MMRIWSLVPLPWPLTAPSASLKLRMRRRGPFLQLASYTWHGMPLLALRCRASPSRGDECCGHALTSMCKERKGYFYIGAWTCRALYWTLLKSLCYPPGQLSLHLVRVPHLSPSQSGNEVQIQSHRAGEWARSLPGVLQALAGLDWRLVFLRKALLKVK